MPPLVPGIVIALIASGPASAQPRPAPRPGQPAAPQRVPAPVGQELAPAELKARQALARAQQLGQSSGHEAEAISAAREALKDHVKPAPGTPDNFALEALSLLVALHSRTGQLAEEVAARREHLDTLSRVLRGGDWRVRDAAGGLADAERRLTATPEQRRQFIDAYEYFQKSFALMSAGRLGEALQAAAKATDLYRGVEGDDHRDVSNVLTLRGIIHRQRREYAAAGSMFEQALLIRKRVLGEDHPDTALVIQHLANLAEVQGDFAHATRLYERTAELVRADAAEESDRRAELLETIGRLLSQQGDHGGARRHLERAATIRERLVMANTWRSNPFGVFHRFGPSGTRLGGRLSDFHEGFVAGYNGMGGPFGGRNRRLDPFGRRQRTTRDRPSLFRSDALGGDMLDGLMGGRGMFGSRRIDDIMAMTANPSHPWTLRLRAMKLYIHASGGKEPQQVEAIASAFEDEAIRGDAWVAYARDLGRLADVAAAQGDDERARLLRLRSVAIGLEATDPSEATRGAYAEFLDGFITLILEMGESRLAEDLAVQSLVDRKLAWGDGHPAYAAGLDRLAEVVWARRDRLQAMLLFEKARAIRRLVHGDGHFELAASSYRLSLLHEESGDRDEARRRAGEALALSESFVMAGLPFLPERQRLAFLAQSSRALSLFLDVTDTGADDTREAYRHLLAWKGVATEAAAAQRASASPELRALSEELNRSRDALNQLFYAAVPPEQAAAHARRIREQTRLRHDLEARLAEAVRWHPTPPRPDQVAGALQHGAVLVDFTLYQHYVPAPGAGDRSDARTPSRTHFRMEPGAGPSMRFEPRYAAFVVRHGVTQPVRVELGPAAAIDAAVEAWLDRIERGDDLDGPARQLARVLWDPLAPHIGNAREVLISPDGALNFLPWGALPGKSPGAYLLSDHAFSLVGAARFLAQGRRGAGAPRGRDLLAVGGVDYLAAEAAPPPGDGRAQAASRTAPVGGRGLSLMDLPGTLVEARAIIDLFLREAPGGGEAMLLSGPRVTKERVRTSLAGKRYLHLATHGYFASPEFRSALVPEDTGAPVHSLEGMDRSEVRGLYPGLLSGLIFAGANQPPKDPGTGLVDFGAAIMTAEEIAGLDLSRCDLAVLSACETGRGSIAGGEGVLGLQRAFHQAGARTVVASLWKVDDRATSALMALFYDRLWRREMPAIEALRDAQLTLSIQPELVEKLAAARGTPELDKLLRSTPNFDQVVDRPASVAKAGPDRREKDRAPVRQWAAFVLSGWGE